MTLLKVGAAVMNQTPLDWEGNVRRILAAIEQGKAQRIAILCCPELSICGYGCEDVFYGADVVTRSLQCLEQIQLSTKGIAVSVGLPIRIEHTLYNCACLLVDGEILGFVPKQNLAGDGIYYEPRWFKAWHPGERTEISIGNRTYPFGDIYFQLGTHRIGFEICEDAWVGNRPGAKLQSKGVNFILNPSASHFAFGKFETRKAIVLSGSRDFQVTYVYTNLLGNESGRAIYDGGALIAQDGRLLAQGPRFSFQEVLLTSTIVDTRSPARAEERDGQQVHSDFCLSNADNHDREVLELAAWEQSSHLKEEEFCRAEALALFDYLRKSGLQGFVLSLSGGADSGTVACLVWLMVKFAAAELGLEHCQKRLGLPTTLPSEQALMKKLLFCVYQRSANSSKTTSTAARELAVALHAEFTEVDIAPLVDGYLALAESALGRKLEWSTDDLALQNIQARSRAPSAWLFANLRNALLLVTSNRSEAAVGYATMDGDTAGSISPLGGIDKAFIRSFLRWMETFGPCGAEPLPVLKLVNVQAPTAELRPANSHQTDETDLMPYEFLDRVERAVLLKRQSPLEILKDMVVSYPERQMTELAGWIEKFFTLWCRNQWKRERYAPAFHLDDESLDPKTWCRFPILSGGYRAELAEMQAYVKSKLAK